MIKTLLSFVLRQLSADRLFQISLSTLGCLLLTSDISLAQVTSDGTVNTQVNQNGNVAEITGGERAGDNLFHSFQDFSVGTGDTASFLNANDIANIFSRVTGGNISNIDGLISANGSANLFLINPAGILFGENARLDVGGSFLGSTADSILFEDGEFSATDLNNPPVITINAPIGLNLRDQPGDIVNRAAVEDSTGEFVGLEVAPGNNLAFVGGDINFEVGDVTVRGGNVELGGLSAAGIVGINPDGSLSFPESVPRADVNFNVSDVDVRGTGGGNITVNARNLNLEGGEFNGEPFGSVLRSGINADSTSPEAQAGDITINATKSVALDSSFIFNNVETDAVGNSGKINLTTPNLSLTNSSSINTDNFGQGNADLININATESITLNDSNISSRVTSVTSDTEGNGGELNITTPNLSLTNFGLISVSTFGQGDGGKLSINTANLSLTNFSSIIADSFGQGDAGSIDINATESITLNDSFSGISSGVSFDAEGNGGEVNINTPNLSLTNFSSINGDTYGQGDGGSIDINATESITLDDSSDISSTVSSLATGNGGEVNINTPNLSLTNSSSIDADIFGQGNGGSIDINATESITLNEFSSISSTAGFDETKNNGGEVNITTANLSLTNGGSIDANAYGVGNAGLININATESITFNDSFISSTVGVDQSGNAAKVNITAPNLFLISSFIEADTFGSGNAGKLTIASANISLTDSSISADTFGQEDGGSIDINATESITLDNSSISSSVTFDAKGNSGNLNITTPNLSLNSSFISADTRGQGDGGSININAPESITLDDSSISTTAGFSEEGGGNGGNIQISTGDFSLTNNASVDASTSGIGNGGEINITANNFSLTNGGEIFASTFGSDAENIAQGDGGNIAIDVADTFSVNDTTTGAGIFASNQGNSTGNAGNIDITASKLSLINGGQINSFTRGRGNAGNTTINA